MSEQDGVEQRRPGQPPEGTPTPPHWETQQPTNGQYPGNQQPHGQAQSGQPQWDQPQWGQPQSGPPQSGQSQWGPTSYGHYDSVPGYRQPLYVAPPKPGSVPLRPLLFGEILDGAFQTVRRNPKAMLGAAFLAHALMAIIIAVFTAVSAASAFSLEDQLLRVDDSAIAWLVLGLAGGSIVVVLLTIFISAVLQGAMVVPVARAVLNRHTTFGQMWSLSRTHAWALVRLAAVYLGAVVIGLGLVILLSYLVLELSNGQGALLLLPLWLGVIVLAVWIGVKVMVAPAAIVVEELGTMAGLRRSWALTRFQWWRLLGITLLVAVLVSVITQIVTFPIGMLSGMVTDVAVPHADPAQTAIAAVVTAALLGIVTGAFSAVAYAYQTSVMALLYLDLRMRSEGLDIVLHRQLESGSDPDGVPGRPTSQGAGFGPGQSYGPARYGS